MNLYEILGVAKDATAKEIKTAYKKLAQRNHPDKGGDPELFAEIAMAYETLGNNKKRNNYDITGSVKDLSKTVEANVESLFESAIENNTGGNIIKSCIDQVEMTRDKIKRTQEKIKKEIERYESKKGRILSVKSINVFEEILNYKIEMLKETLEQMKIEKSVAKLVLKELESYADDKPEVFSGFDIDGGVKTSTSFYTRTGGGY